MGVKESWNTRIGVILAVSGSAVGLGNFLRFPGQVAQYGGGAFMVAYFISFLIIGLPICWAEWSMGRYGGQRGFHTTVGILHSIVRHKIGKYLGVIGIVIPVIIYMYYVLIEAWCLGYAVNFLAGNMNFSTAAEASAFFTEFTGAGGDGTGLGLNGASQVGYFLLFCFVLNFFLIYRGIAKGIELFCRYAMPALIILAMIILVRVLTLGTPDAENPDRSISAGLGFMWNPSKTLMVTETPLADGTVERSEVQVLGREQIRAAREAAAADAGVTIRTISMADQMKNPDLWLAAASQIFFSLSVGFGIIMTYASYLKKDDDVVLSGLAATSANEFAEVALGGLITIPASVAFLGVVGISGAIGSTFALGFHVLPMVFSAMPFGAFFGFLFFFLLFLAAVTSSLSMLQPGIAFLESAMAINRKQSVAILGFITGIGALFVVYFSGNLKALDTMDFWVGSFLIFILATIQIIVFSWVMGIDEGFAVAHQGAHLRIPRFFGFVMKYVSPVFLLAIFFMWVTQNLFGYNVFTGESSESPYVRDLFGRGDAPADPVAWMSVLVILLFVAFVLVVVNSSAHFRRLTHTRVPARDPQNTMGGDL
ncbi:MAG: sodium:calcium symporter [Opitutales bacterium]|nr:sodium:calcium symporter [Opitutales bacterium]